MTARDSQPDTAPPPREPLLAEGRWAVLLLVCGGIWLHAADTTVVATVMPAAVQELGGAAWVGWAWMLELVGAILAAAGCGLLAARRGAGQAAALAALVFALGCCVTALAADMGGFLAGRLLQGLGGGALVALCHIGIALAFPERLWARAYAVVALVWGFSALAGPLVGGVFAEAGYWQGAFWAFALQALAAALAAPRLLPRQGGGTSASGLPGPSLALLVPGVLAIGLAGVLAAWWLAAATALAGLLLLLGFLKVELRAGVSLLPRRSLPLAHVRAGLVAALTLTLAAISFATYGPLLLQALHGLSPLQFGYITALELVAWSLLALLTSRLDPRVEGPCLRWGPVMIVSGLLLFAFTLPRGPLWGVILAALLQGGGFGLCWTFVARRIVAAARPEEREQAAGALPTVQMLGYALGAAAAGIVANGLGFAGEGGGAAGSAETLRDVARWLFLAFLPPGLLGVAAAWRLSR